MTERRLPPEQKALYSRLRSIWLQALAREVVVSVVRFGLALYVLVISAQAHWMAAIFIVAIPLLLSTFRAPVFRPLRWLAAALGAVVGPLAAPFVALGLIVGALTGRLNRPLFWSRSNLRAIEPFSSGGYRFELMDDRIALIYPAPHGAGYIVTVGPDIAASFRTLAEALSSVVATSMTKAKPA